MSKEFKRAKQAEKDGDYVRAVAMARRAMDQGNADAQLFLANLMVLGRGIEKDPAAAAELLRALASKGNTEAMVTLAAMYLEGNGVAKNAAEALQLNLTAANKGNKVGQFHLGNLYAQGVGAEKDEKEAVRWYKKAAEQSFHPAVNSLAYMMEHGRGVAKNEKEAFRLYRKVAVVPDGMIGLGYAPAQANMARMYATGRGMKERSEKDAAIWYRKAAEQGHLDAAFRLALMYIHGMGIHADVREGLRWCHLAAEQGHVLAQNELGDLYSTTSSGDASSSSTSQDVVTDDGTPRSGNVCGIDKDDRKSFYWYAAAAKKRNANAQLSLGLCFLEGRGTPQDILRGVYLCELAASQKHVKAARYVGQLYERGIPGSNGREGLSKDPARAMAWLKYAADPDTSSPPAINEYSPSQQEQQQLQSTSTSTAALDAMKAKVQQLEKQVEQLLALQEQKRKVTRCLECDAPVQKFVHGVKMGDEADIYEEGGAVSDDDEEY